MSERLEGIAHEYGLALQAQPASGAIEPLALSHAYQLLGRRALGNGPGGPGHGLASPERHGVNCRRGSS